MLSWGRAREVAVLETDRPWAFRVAVIPDGVRPDARWALVRASDWPLAERIRDELQKG